MTPITEFISQCDRRIELNGLESLSEDERVVYLVNLVDFEVSMGGLSGFYCNSSGNLTAEVVSALERIGAIEASKALKESALLFGTADSLRDREHRQDLLSTASGRLRVFEEIYYSQNPTLIELTDSYYSDHELDKNLT